MSEQCPNGHAAEWHVRWGGERADYICTKCQSFHDREVTNSE